MGACIKCHRQIELRSRTEPGVNEGAKTKVKRENDVFLDDIFDVAWTELDATEMIIDSGCRRSVAGRDWHERLQGRLSEIGLHAIQRQ